MSDDLVKRLRSEDPETGLRWSLASEAADFIEWLVNEVFNRSIRIAELEAELEKVRDDLDLLDALEDEGVHEWKRYDDAIYLMERRQEERAKHQALEGEQ